MTTLPQRLVERHLQELINSTAVSYRPASAFSQYEATHLRYDNTAIVTGRPRSYTVCIPPFKLATSVLFRLLSVQHDKLEGLGFISTEIYHETWTWR